MLRSFRSRLLIGTTIWVFVALLASFGVLSHLFRHQVTALFEEELRGHLDELIGLAELDAEEIPGLRHSLNDPRFEVLGGSFYWEIRSEAGRTARSPSLAGASFLPAGSPPLVDGRSLVTGVGPAGPIMTILGRKSLPSGGDALLVGIAADTQVVDVVLRRFDDELAFSLATIGAGLVIAAWASITFGFYPLRRIRAALSAIHTGKASRLPDDFPTEVSGLARDVNRLIDANQETVRRARVEVGRLAHGLKTPLAIMLAEARRLEAGAAAEAGREIAEQCERMQRQIEYQLSTSRPGGAAERAPGDVTVLGPAVREVIVALSALYSDRKLSFELDGDLDLLAACASEDVHEIVGNLVDNAGKWARTLVRTKVGATERGLVTIRVEDDGPGLPKEARDRVFDVGARFDESKPGSGLGLAIVRDLVRRYGGSVRMERSDLGGAAAYVELPAAPAI